MPTLRLHPYLRHRVHKCWLKVCINYFMSFIKFLNDSSCPPSSDSLPLHATLHPGSGLPFPSLPFPWIHPILTPHSYLVTVGHYPLVPMLSLLSEMTLLCLHHSRSSTLTPRQRCSLCLPPRCLLQVLSLFIRTCTHTLTVLKAREGWFHRMGGMIEIQLLLISQMPPVSFLLSGF